MTYEFLHSSFSLLIGIFGFSMLIVIHEFGHFLFCKLFQIKVTTFSIGFGPSIISTKLYNTDFKIATIPLGGYVEIAQKNDHVDNPTSEHFFEDQALYKKLLVMFGGIMFNLMFAYLSLSLLFMLGLPKSPMLAPANISNTIAKVREGSEAEKAGFKIGDIIITIDGNKISEPLDKIPGVAHGSVLHSVTIIRDQNELILKLPIEASLIKSGIHFELKELAPKSFFESIVCGIRLTNQFILGTISLLKNLITQRDTSNIGGPIMIIAATTASAYAGLKVLLAILALLSISLAVLNLVPLPILDGGQILFTLIEAVIRRPLPIKIREYIAIINWVLFLLLFIYLSVKDIGRLQHFFKNSFLIKLFIK